MFVFLILPILVSGFIVCNKNPYYKYKIHRYEGQYLYFLSAMLGTFSLFIASIFASLIYEFAPSSIYFCGREITVSVTPILKSLLTEVWQEETKADLIAFIWIMILSIVTILVSYIWTFLAWIWVRIKQCPFEKYEIFLIYKVLSENPMEKLFFESWLDSKPIMLSLDSRKIYVGIVTSLGELSESNGMDQDISIVPLMSGYRDENTLKIKFVTYYKTIDTDLNTVIRQELIQTATHFDFKAYNKLNPSDQLTHL